MNDLPHRWVGFIESSLVIEPTMVIVSVELSPAIDLEPNMVVAVANDDATSEARVADSMDGYGGGDTLEIGSYVQCRPPR
jgi:hypothetical protein